MTPTKGRTLARSEERYRRARTLIPGGTQTISKQPERFVAGVYPAYLQRARGARVWDLDGNEYLDYVLALGPVILGYCDPDVDAAAKAAIDAGVLHSSSNPLELDLAEALCGAIPCAEMVRYFKGGADACSAAVRVARAVTGRDHVVCCGYHGWHDWWAGKRGEPGVPPQIAELTIDLPYGDLERVRALFEEQGGRIAALFVEAVVFRYEPAFLAECRRLCDRYGAVLIFDEIITGFRLALGGVQELTGVVPDLATFGKAMANGYPIAALVGRREILKEAAKLWISVTYGSEGASIAAAIATIRKLRETGGIGRLTEHGTRLREVWTRLAIEFPEAGMQLGGVGSLAALAFADEPFETAFLTRMLERGYLIRRGHYWFTSLAHTGADLDRTFEEMREVLSDLRSAHA